METRLVDVRIDRASPVPLWHQLAQQLTAAVDDGRLQPGDPFENELALAARLNVSRPTVRRAMQEMVDRGLLVRRRGIGTTVANRKVHRRAVLSSLHDDLLRAGQVPTTSVLELRSVRDARAAAALDLPLDTDLLAIVGAQPVLTMTRTAFGGTGEAIEFGDHCYRAEDYSLDLLLDER